MLLHVEIGREQSMRVRAQGERVFVRPRAIVFPGGVAEK